MDKYYATQRLGTPFLLICLLIIGVHGYSQGPPTPDSNGIVYVKPTATGTGSGDSWANATADLKGAINAVGTTQVWVMVGTYDTQGIPFVMKNQVAIYGGFDPDNGVSSISDPRIIMDTSGVRGSILHAYGNGRVIANIFTVDAPLDNSAILDGFTITGANTTEIGGGIYNYFASVWLRNLVVIDNSANGDGGGICNIDSSPIMSGLFISGNIATKGAGLVNYQSNAFIENTIISNNYARLNGGGVHNRLDTSRLFNTLITDNHAEDIGGGIYDESGGGIYMNVTVANNGSNGFYGHETTQLYNSVVWDSIYGAEFQIRNSLIKGSGDITNGNVDATAITAADVFNDISNADYSLSNTSPAINAGDNTFYTNHGGDLSSDKDLAGMPRLYQGRPSEDKVDLGAYEFQGEPVKLLHILTWDGESIYIVAHQSDAIQQIKQKIETALGVPVMQQVLAFGSTVLEDGRTLADYEIVLEDTLLLSLAPLPTVENILYVDANVDVDAGGYTGVGNSWPNASKELAEVLRWAREQIDNGTASWDEFNPLRIFIAKGTYKPHFSALDGYYNLDQKRRNSFVMVPNVQLYGGFDPVNGIKTLEDKRILPNHEMDFLSGTVLSGDLNGDDSIVPTQKLAEHTSRQDNTNHVVIISGPVGSASIDGLTITGGNSWDPPSGSSVLKVNGEIIIEDHSGGGIIINSSQFFMKNCAIWKNSAYDSAGGVHMLESFNTTLNHVIISMNTAHNAAGIKIVDSNPLLGNMLIVENIAKENSGGVDLWSDATIINATIARNSAGLYGGGIGYHPKENVDGISPSIYNSIISANDIQGVTSDPNSSVYIFGEIPSSFLTIEHSLISHSGGSMEWHLESVIDGGNNIDQDPEFTTTTMGEAGYMELMPTSAAINNGSNLKYDPRVGDIQGNDLIGNPRVYDFSGDGVIDMGAIEFQGDYLPYIKSVSTLDSIVVEYGTDLYAIENVPAQVQATLSDDTTVLVSLDLDPDHWILKQPTSGSYDPNIAGTYIFEVPLIMPGPDDTPGLVNRDGLLAELEITVSKDVPDLRIFWQGNRVDVTSVFQLEYGEVGEFLIESNDSDAVLTYSFPVGVTPILDLSDLTAVIAQQTGDAVLTVQQAETDNFEAAELHLTVMVSPKAITVIPEVDQSKKYGEADPIFSLLLGEGSELENGDQLSDLISGINREVGQDVGNYDLLPIFEGEKVDNYDITFEVDNDAFAIKPALLDIIVDADQGKSYGGKDPIFSYTVVGLVNGDDESVISGTLSREDGEESGTYDIELGNLSAGANYQINLITNTFTINQGVLYVAVNPGQGKQYGETDPPLSFSVEGFVNGDDDSILSGALIRQEGENVGIYPVELGDLRADSNYKIHFIANDFTVTPALLNITVDADQSKLYGSIDPIFSYTVSGLVNGDDESVLSGALSREVGESIGTYTVEQGNLSAGDNYQINFTGAEFSITLVIIDIVVDLGQGKRYGETDPEITYTATGFVNNDTPEILTGSLSRGSGEDVGSYPIDIGSLSAGQNYQLRLASADFTITAVPLEIIADPGLEKTYGSEDPVFTYTVTGLVNNDTQEILTGSLSRQPGEDVGSYLIEQGTLNAGSNYEVVISPATFEILKVDQEILWEQELVFDCREHQQIVLTATSSSGLPVSYQVSQGSSAQLQGNILILNAREEIVVTAFQQGNQNFNPSSPIEKVSLLKQGGLVRQQWDDVLVFDNSSASFVSFQWYKNGTAVPGATKQYYSEEQALNGEYYVLATKSNGEVVTTCPLIVLGENYQRTIRIVPNPVNSGDSFAIIADFDQSQLDEAVVSIFDISGKLVENTSVTGGETILTAPLQKGIYIISIVLSDGQRKTANLLVK